MITSCTHRVQHQHGTHTGYDTCGCRCDDCRHAHTTHRKTRRHIMRGQITTSAARTRLHLCGLIAAGMTQAEIARAADMDHQSVCWLMVNTQRVSRDVERRILSVKVGVTAVGVRRRLQALQAVGWTCTELGQRLGLPFNGVSQIACGSRTPLGTSRLRQDVPEAYEAMWRGPENPSVRVMASAHRKGWAPPLAWDDESIDDARTEPRGLISTTRTDLVADLIELAESGESWEQATVRVGYENEQSLKRQLHRSGCYQQVAHAFGLVVAA